MMKKMKKAAEPDNTERKLFLKYIEYTKERLVSALISAALNVYHQRSNLSAWLVEGGQEELNRLSNLKLAS